MYFPHASHHGNGSTDPQSNWMHYLHSVLHFNLNYLISPNYYDAHSFSLPHVTEHHCNQHVP